MHGCACVCALKGVEEVMKISRNLVFSQHWGEYIVSLLLMRRAEFHKPSSVFILWTVEEKVLIYPVLLCTWFHAFTFLLLSPDLVFSLVLFFRLFCVAVVVMKVFFFSFPMLHDLSLEYFGGFHPSTILDKNSDKT